ncbi:MAG: hypothetical protein KGS61_05445 [Verrucomicrobia bacterium]|nr:hypothetical protein [Verrucomicrobiota bacterium]
MQRAFKSLVLTMALLVGAARTRAQGHGNTFLIPLRDTNAAQATGSGDAQLRRQIMERYRKALRVTSDQEWRRISPSIQKVVEARFQIRLTGAGHWRPNRTPHPRTASSPPPAGQPSAAARLGPEAQDLEEAIRDRASADQLEKKVERLRDLRRTKRAELQKARADLRKKLTVREEAAAMLVGLL